MVSDTTTPLDEVLNQVGDFGRYQLVIAALLIVAGAFPCAFIDFSHVFISAVPDHWCAPPPELLSLLQGAGDQRSEWMSALIKNLTVPRVLKDGVMQFSQCEMFAVNYSVLMQEDPRWRADAVSRILGPNESRPRQKCQHLWEYDRTDYDETLVTKYNLVCDQDWWSSFCLSAFYTGSLFGAMMAGSISDRYGRRPSFFLVLFLDVIIPVASAFAPNYTVYIVTRFLIGFTFPGCYQTPYILIMELTGTSYRTGVGMIMGMTYGVAVSVLCLVAYLTREWFSLTLWSSVPFGVFFIYYWIIPESPRWLVQQNRLEEAETVFQTIAKWNSRTVPRRLLCELMMENNVMTIQEATEKTAPESTKLLHLMRTPNMRKKILLLMFISLSNTIVYFGLSLMSSNLGMSDYLTFSISGLVEAPSCLVAWYVMERLGRRWPCALAMMFVGLCCLANIFVPEDMTWLTVLLPSLGKFGITGTFAMVYVFGVELLPTVIRGGGMAMVGFICCLCLIPVPFIIYLVVYMRVLPLLVMGFLSVLGGVAALFLPETLGRALPDTFEDGERFGKELKVLPDCKGFK